MKPQTSFGHFAKLWDKKVGNQGAGNKQITTTVIKFLGDISGKKIYDVACGNGFLSRKLLAKKAKTIYASDIAPELIEIAQTKYPADGIKYLVQTGDDFKNIPKNYFDSVVIHQGIFYIKKLENFIKGVSESLKPKGTFVFTMIHPLFPNARKAAGDTTAFGEPIDDVTMNEKYLTTYESIVTKQWGEENTEYLVYKRPMQTYINLCAKYNLLINQIAEIPYQANNPKHNKTNIPGSLIIRCTKIKN